MTIDSIKGQDLREAVEATMSMEEYADMAYDEIADLALEHLTGKFDSEIVYDDAEIVREAMMNCAEEYFKERGLALEGKKWEDG